MRQKQAALQQSQVDLEYTSIRAPVDGTVISRTVDVGQTVAASLQAPTLFTIAQDLTKMQIDTNVDEADIGRTQVGQRVTFTVDSFPNRDVQRPGGADPEGLAHGAERGDLQRGDRGEQPGPEAPARA